ncbi:MAG: response regulator transcription factor [Erysipelotrichaceae bacterium]
MIRILVVDDHELIVESMKAILSQQTDMTVVAGARSGTEALELVRQHVPDLIITDVYMPGGDGMELTRKVKSEYPEIRILALTIFDDDNTVRAMLEAGVDGIVSKDLRKDNLILTIKNTMAGLSVLDLKAFNKFKEIYQSPAYKDQQIMTKFALNPIELSIIRSVAQGLSNQQIAEQLFISESTVKHRLASLMDNFGVQDRVQLAVSAAKNGIL